MPGKVTLANMVTVSGLVHRYSGADVLRLGEWRVQAGEAWAVLGPSGSGKSTLLHVLCGLIRPAAGRVEVAGTEVTALAHSARDRFRADCVGIVLQSLHLVSHLTVRDNIRLAQYLAHRKPDDALINAALGAVGLADKAHRRPPTLSQGERQRVAIARAVINRPKLLLADEPTANLDDASTAATMDLLAEQARRHGATLVVATHDMRVKSRLPNRLELPAA